MKKPDLLGALKPVIDAFDRLAIPYYIGGSIASSAYGIPRATMHAYHQITLARRVTDRLVDDDPNSMVCLASPEDVILSKLQWYQMGQGVSERQWLDILGVIKVQGDSLDAEYLRTWAETLGVHDLWQRACSESGLKP